MQEFIIDSRGACSSMQSKPRQSKGERMRFLQLTKLIHNPRKTQGKKEAVCKVEHFPQQITFSTPITNLQYQTMPEQYMNPLSAQKYISTPTTPQPSTGLKAGTPLAGAPNSAYTHGSVPKVRRPKESWLQARAAGTPDTPKNNNRGKAMQPQKAAFQKRKFADSLALH